MKKEDKKTENRNAILCPFLQKLNQSCFPPDFLSFSFHHLSCFSTTCLSFSPFCFFTLHSYLCGLSLYFSHISQAILQVTSYLFAPHPPMNFTRSHCLTLLSTGFLVFFFAFTYSPLCVSHLSATSFSHCCCVPTAFSLLHYSDVFFLSCLLGRQAHISIGYHSEVRGQAGSAIYPDLLSRMWVMPTQNDELVLRKWGRCLKGKFLVGSWSQRTTCLYYSVSGVFQFKTDRS